MFEWNLFKRNLFERNLFERNLFERNLFDRNLCERNFEWYPSYASYILWKFLIFLINQVKGLVRGIGVLNCAPLVFNAHRLKFSQKKHWESLPEGNPFKLALKCSSKMWLDSNLWNTLNENCRKLQKTLGELCQ